MYAHTGKQTSRADWEPLAKHLAEVGDMAAGFASHFGAAEIARAMGALHDVGKAKDEFQRYLIESCAKKESNPGEALKSPGHSTEGAVIARERYGKDLGKLMAFGIAGHHAGLANGSRGGGGIGSLKDRLDGAEPFKLPVDCDLAPTTVEGKIPFSAFSAAFLTRMLFSCLVDADRLATEAFDAERKGEKVERGWNGELTTLRDRLNAYLDGLRGKGEAVDHIRRDILAAARSKADQEPGLFTLTVPTGGGKTLSSLAFALDHAITHGMRRVIYVIPFTSVVEQTADVFREALKDDKDEIVLEHHSAFDAEMFFKSRNDKDVGKDEEGASGEVKLRQAMENWDRPVIVTTAVQFFESLFSNRTSACRKLHNIAKSVVILDEAQTIPLHVLRPCLAAIQELADNYKTSLVLCTATQPAVFQSDYPGFKAKPLKERLESQWLRKKREELAPDVAGLFEKLRRVTVTRLPEPLGDDDLAQRLSDAPSALCIVNNRRHARELTLKVREKFGEERAKEEVFHLSTCMCAAHRRKVLAAVKRRLKDKLPTRVVATSLVEAGVDFSFPVVYRAVAGLESIAQAAGRCNRNGDLPELGQVFVFEPAPDENHKPPHALKQFADIGEGVLKAHADPLSPDALTAYFKAVYWSKEDRLDDSKLGDSGTGVMQALKKYHETRDYPFADIGAGFRFIDSPMVPVIVTPKGAENVVGDLIGALRNHAVQRVGGLARKLQPYVVQVPHSALGALLKAKAAEVIRQEDFGDQFVLLTNRDIYFDDVGLDWSDPSFRSVEGDMF